MQDSQEEKQGKQKKKNQRKGLYANVDFSVALSFIVAAFALFSIASFGIINNQNDSISYAAPTSDSFRLVIPDYSSENISGITGYTEDGTRGFNVPMYYADSVSEANRVFCTEIHVPWDDGVTYNKGNLASDPGLVYILKNSYANGKKITTYSGDYATQVEVWATQAAIWLYLADKNPSDSKYQFFADNEEMDGTVMMQTKAGLLNTVKFKIRGGGTEHSGNEINLTGVPAKVNELVTRAKTASGSATEGKITLNASEDLSKTADGEYYQTGLISVVGTPADAMTSYTIKSVTGIEGAKIVDENGNDLALENIPAGKKFYARVPVKKVTEENKTLRIDVVGNFKAASGVYYVSTGYQTVIALKDEVTTDEKGIEFEIVGAPDTGMNAAQTIYFIGLIVLLCGVGIVYANTKPVESKQ